MLHLSRVTSPNPALLAPLCALLIEAVDGGASVGFLAPLSAATATAYWEQVLAALGETLQLWVAEQDGQLLGTVQLALCPKENGKHRAEVQKLLVAQAARGQGIARRLMVMVEADAHTQGRTLLVLDTQTGSVAESVYQRLGWTKGGEIPNYATTPHGQLHSTSYFYKLLDPSQLTERERELWVLGKECALRGGHYRENPYFTVGGADWEYLVWHRSFVDHRTPDPQCPLCHGSGFQTLCDREGQSPYNGVQVRCWCNVAVS